MKKRCLCAHLFPDLFIQCKVLESNHIVDKYAVSVQRDGEVVGQIMKSKSDRFTKTIFYFFACNKKNNCTVVVTGKAD